MRDYEHIAMLACHSAVARHGGWRISPETQHSSFGALHNRGRHKTVLTVTTTPGLGSERRTGPLDLTWSSTSWPNVYTKTGVTLTVAILMSKHQQPLPTTTQDFLVM